MPAQIESDKILIKDVFQRWFRVPEYQRPYVWGNDEISELLEDISNALQTRPQSQYFLGSIVYQTQQRHDASGNPYEELDLLDGQQRLTTCLLLHAVGRDLATDPQLQKACHKAIYQEADPYDGIPERGRIVYDIRPDVQDFVQQFLQSQGGTNDTAQLNEQTANDKDTSVRHMAGALLQIRAHFEQHDPQQLGEFFRFFRNNVLLIYVASTELEDAFRLFTVLNDRGMKLRNSDILKTLNLSALREQNALPQEVRQSASDWEEMENELGEGFDIFLGHVRTVLVKEQARKTLLEEFEDNVYKPRPPATQPVLSPGRETFKAVKRYRSHFSEITTGNNHSQTYGYTLDNLVTLLRGAARADYWMPPLLYYRDAFGSADMPLFLKKLDNKFMAGWVRRDTPSARSEAMNRILREMDKIKQNANLSDVQKQQAVLALSEFDFDVDDVLNRIDTNPIYGQPYAMYLLYKMDLIFAGQHTVLQPALYLSVEHVLPQTPAAASLWNQSFTVQEQEDWTNRFGNLVLIGRRKNASLGNKDFADKKQNYFHSHIQPFPNSLRVMQYSNWTPTELQDNHAKVIAALKQWCQ